MGKVRKTKKNTFNYSVNRKKLKRKARKKDAPRIACNEIRKAWDDTKSVAVNLAHMGLATDPNKAIPIGADAGTSAEENKYVRKPYVIEELKASASLPSKKTMGISSDMVLYVRHMVENYGEDYKASSFSLIRPLHDYLNILIILYK